MDAVKRVRLSPEERRAQLIDLGVRMLADRPLEQISVEDIADQAGVSRGLLFHYFASKHDFHVAIVRHSSAEMLARTAPNLELPVIDMLRDVMAAYVDYVSENRDTYVSLLRGPRVVIRRCARCSRAPEPRWRDASSNNCRVSESSPTPASPCRCGDGSRSSRGHDHVAARTRNPPGRTDRTTCHRLARGGPQRRRRGGPSRRLTLPRVLRTYRGGRVLDLAFCALIAGDGCWISRFAHLSRGRPIRGRERHRPAHSESGRAGVVFGWSADQRDHFVGENAVSMISCCSTA